MTVWLAIGLAVVANPVSCTAILGMSMWRGKSASIRNYEQLDDPQLSARVGRRLALYAQSDPRLFPEYLSCESLLPERYRIDVSTNSVDLTAGGGFHHYGYSLRLRDGNGEAATHSWRFVTRSDMRPRIDLPDVVLSKEERLPAGDAMRRVVSNLTNQLVLTPSNEDLHRRKVDFLVSFGELDAAQTACRHWTRDCPESPAARSSLALVARQVQAVTGTRNRRTTLCRPNPPQVGSRQRIPDKGIPR